MIALPNSTSIAMPVQTPFRLVHLATHGQFSSNAEDTFVLTWDDRIDINELSRLLRGDSKTTASDRTTSTQCL